VENKIIYTPSRNDIEKITTVRKSEVIFLENHLEHIISYDWVSEESEGCRNRANLLPRIGMVVSLDECDWPADPGNYRPVVVVGHSGLTDPVYIFCSSQKETDDLYLKIRSWILAQ
jgi:hypothetical protein